MTAISISPPPGPMPGRRPVPPPPPPPPPPHGFRDPDRHGGRDGKSGPMPLSFSDPTGKLVIRQAPGSPVMVNFQAEPFVRPFNVDIEHARPVEVAEQAERPERSNRLHSESATDATDTPAYGLPAGSAAAAPVTGPDAAYLSSDYRRPFRDPNRLSRESSATTAQPPSIAESAATTLASSVETIGCPELSVDDYSAETLPEEAAEPVPTFQYHHHQMGISAGAGGSGPAPADPTAAAAAAAAEAAAGGDRLSPSQYRQKNASTRPQSAVYADPGHRGSSPGGGSLQSSLTGPQARTPSISAASTSRRSPESRPVSYAELLNVPYPQPAPAPMALDNSNLRNAVGNNASLLSTQKTLEMYRQNVKKTGDPSVQYSFAVFLISTAQELGGAGHDPDRAGGRSSPGAKTKPAGEGGLTAAELIKEARQILQKLASGGYPFAQYYLADGYASGLFGSKGREDYGQAFPLFVLAAKHGHAESAYRAALCYEFGAGCRKDPARAVQFLRSAAAKGHPGAMSRLGQACLSGDLGERRYREGIKWMKLATESADGMYNQAPYQLGRMYEAGYGDDIFRDEGYAAELYTQAAELGHVEAGFRMGEAYEHGQLSCPRDPALSVHFYTGAAERGHAAAMMGLCAWYMVGAEPILEPDLEEAYEWACRSAELDFVKAQYAVGYFTEMGIGCRRDILEANRLYVKAADAGDERAKQRLAAIRAAASGGEGTGTGSGSGTGTGTGGGTGGGGGDGDGPAAAAAAPPRGSNKIRKTERPDEGQCAVM